MRSLKQEKGFLLISAFMVLIFLAILSGAIFSQSLSENVLARNSLTRLQAKYNAEFGFNCAAYELLRSSDWSTHTSDIAEPYLLTKQGTPPTTTDGLGTITPSDPEGNYAVAGVFETKLYKDPLASQNNQFIVLSRGISSGKTYLLAAKVSIVSLYEYFRFTPYIMDLGGATYSAEGGKMHANSNIVFGSYANIENVAELSTPRYIKYSVQPELPPANNCNRGNGNCRWDEYYYWLRPPWSTPNSMGDFYNNPDGMTAAQRKGLYMLNQEFINLCSINCGGGNCPQCWSYYGDGTNPARWAFIPCTVRGDCLLPEKNPTDPVYGSNQPAQIVYTHADYLKRLEFPPDIYSSLTAQHAKIQACKPPECNPAANTNPSIQIPSRFAGFNPDDYNNNNYFYEWDKHEGFQYTFDWGSGTKTYTHTPVLRRVNFMNTEKQPYAWQEWLYLNQNRSLQGIIRERNTGGTYIEPSKVTPANYQIKAQQEGIYIEKDAETGEPKLFLNGNEIVSQNGTSFEVDGEIIARKESFIDPNSALEKNVLAIDIAKMKEVEISPNNGIMYSDYDVAIKNAQTLFNANAETGYNGGLTTVAKENCFLIGNYNTTDWKPSAVISAKYVYTLSSTFSFDDFNNLKDTIHNPNFPYVADGNWFNTHRNQMAPQVSADTEYYVSIVGYNAYEPKVLERWCERPGEGGACFKRTIVGANVRLNKGDFPWYDPDYPDNPREIWPYLDKDKPRLCSDTWFVSEYPSAPCRGAYSGWQSDMTSIAPQNRTYNNNIFRYEARYNFNDASTLPPGGLPGYVIDIRLEIPDTVYNRSHHYAPLN